MLESFEDCTEHAICIKDSSQMSFYSSESYILIPVCFSYAVVSLQPFHNMILQFRVNSKNWLEERRLKITDFANEMTFHQWLVPGMTWRHLWNGTQGNHYNWNELQLEWPSVKLSCNIYERLSCWKCCRDLMHPVQGKCRISLLE